MSKKEKTIPVGTEKVNKVKCSFCRNGNCKDVQFRSKLNNFAEVYYCGKDLKVLKYKKVANV